MINRIANNISFGTIDVVHNLNIANVKRDATMPPQAVQVVINSIDEAAKKLETSEMDGTVFVREVETKSMQPGGETGFVDRFKLILSGYNNKTEILQNKIYKLEVPSRSEAYWNSLDKYSLKKLYLDLSEKITKSFESSIKLS